jgi:hypothetical protein
MEQVLDKIKAEIESMRYTLSEDGGIADIISTNAETKWGDPGWVLFDEYPFIIVEPVRDAPKDETIGRTGFDVRLLTVQVSILVLAADYFDPAVSESPGDRVLVRSAMKTQRWLRRLGNRKLDDLEGVRTVVVSDTNYVPQERGITPEGFVKSALITLVVERKYQHEL